MAPSSHSSQTTLPKHSPPNDNSHPPPKKPSPKSKLPSFKRRSHSPTPSTASSATAATSASATGTGTASFATPTRTPATAPASATASATASAAPSRQLSTRSSGQPPSPKDSLKSQSQGLNQVSSSEGRGIGRVAARIKNTILGREGEGEGNGSPRRKSMEGEGGTEGVVGGKNGGKMKEKEKDKEKRKDKENEKEQDMRKPLEESVSGNGKKKNGELKKGWSQMLKGKKNDRWRAKKPGLDAMPPGMLAEKAQPDQLWGRRAVWHGANINHTDTDRGREGVRTNKGRGDVTTLMDESPMPVRLPSTDMIEKVKKRASGEHGQGREQKRERPEEAEEAEEAEEEEVEYVWDEESLLRLSDWWRQILGRGGKPAAKELDMITMFLEDLLEERTPELDMILRTRLHMLLEALVLAANGQGSRDEQNKYRKIAKLADELKNKWLRDLGGQFDVMSERRRLLCEPNGRLERVHLRPIGKHQSRWVVEGPCEESVEFEPGMWWLNDACAERDGMLTNTRTNILMNPNSNPIITLEYGEEMPTHNPTITRYMHVGRIGAMMVPMLGVLDRRVQVLRKYTLKSRLAPVAGLRYDGFFNIVVYSLKRLAWDESTFRVVVELERCMGQRPMEKVAAVPTPSMLDDWNTYLNIKNESLRRSVGEEWWRESMSKEREEEYERVNWHERRAQEDARRADEDRIRAEEDARRADEDARRTVEDIDLAEQMKRAQRELNLIEAQEVEQEKMKREKTPTK